MQSKRLVTFGSILTAIAVIIMFVLPQNPCACRKSAVKEHLQKLYSAQVRFHRSYGRYGDIGTILHPGDTASELQFEVASTLTYMLAIAADSTGYICTATGNIDDDSTLHIMAIDATGHIRTVSDDVSS